MGQLSESSRQSLLKGIDIGDGAASFLSIVDGGGEGANHWYHVALAEGRNREVRRMFEAVGLMVSRLIRTRYGEFILPRALRRGRWEEVPALAVKALMGKFGVKPQGGKEGGEPHTGRRTDAGRKRGPHSGARQPDPMQTALGFPAPKPFHVGRVQPEKQAGQRRQWGNNSSAWAGNGNKAGNGTGGGPKSRDRRSRG